MLPSPSRDSHFFRLFSRQQKIKQRQNGELLKEHTTCISEHTLPNAHTLWKKKGFFFFSSVLPFLTILFLRFSHNSFSSFFPSERTMFTKPPLHHSISLQPTCPNLLSNPVALRPTPSYSPYSTPCSHTSFLYPLYAI